FSYRSHNHHKGDSMQKLLISGLAAAFAVATSATMLMGAATTPAQGPQGLFSIAAQPAAADEENDNGNGEHGNKHNKHHDNNNNNDENDNQNGNNGRQRGHRCHNRNNNNYNNCDNRGNRGGNTTTISGVVENSNGNGSYQFREDNGQVITVIDRNNNLNPGQHYNLNGCFNNGTFTVDCNGYNNGGNNGGYQTSLSGFITTISGSTVTINQNLIGGTVSFDASEAINNNNTNGSLHFGRHITAYGYYDSNHYFHAQSIR
ncbi:MAG: hypothetical protein M3M96_00215, partial [Candidatus Eremiobacteraeota bacterium]|nr:hypothetical protein [Candidatus Eremiobacteraeota bacterium]